MREHWFNEIRNTPQKKNLSKLEQGLQRTGEKRWLERPTKKIQISVYLLCYSLLISLVFEAHIQRQKNSLVYSTCVNWSCWKAICPRLQPAKKRKNHQLWRNTNTECKGSVAIKNYYFCDSRPFGNYLSRDLSPYCERDVKKCRVLASKWESMIEGF